MSLKFVIKKTPRGFTVYYIHSSEPDVGYWYTNTPTYKSSKRQRADCINYYRDTHLSRQELRNRFLRFAPTEAPDHQTIQILKQPASTELRGILGQSAAELVDRGLWD